MTELERIFPGSGRAALCSWITISRLAGRGYAPELLAKAEQIARHSARFRSASAVWYRWAVDQLSSSHDVVEQMPRWMRRHVRPEAGHWHETASSRRELDERAGVIATRETPAEGAAAEPPVPAGNERRASSEQGGPGAAAPGRAELLEQVRSWSDDPREREALARFLRRTLHA